MRLVSIPLTLIVALVACTPRSAEPVKPRQPHAPAVSVPSSDDRESFEAPAEAGSANDPESFAAPAAAGSANDPESFGAPAEAGVANDPESFGAVVAPPSSAPTFGAPRQVGRVAVYPVSLATQSDPGPLVLLETALADGTAEVREVGADLPGTTEAEASAPRLEQRVGNGARHHENLLNDSPQVQGRGGSAAVVDTLVIENKGRVPIYVLAGTIVKGGNQDRQIGQDFVVDAGETLPVDAFCVERGRWNGNRAGADTAGKFVAADSLALGKVRAAGQYQRDQGKVWAEVSTANATHNKKIASDTLLATLDDEEVAARAAALTTKLTASLMSSGPPERIVGFAYAIDGELRGVRWFSHHRVFGLAREKLLRTVALDALTAEEAARARGDSTVAAPPASSAITAFVAEVERSQATETRKTAGLNDNEYKESERAWGSRTVLRPDAANPSPKALSSDYYVK